MLRRIAILTTAFLLLTTTARANDFLFSVASGPVIAPLFLLWLVLGLLIRMKRKDLAFFGAGSLVFVCCGLLFLFMFCHPEITLCFWMIYLGVLATYFLFPGKNVSKKERSLNLSFHGTFLVLVIIGGIAAKAVYYSNMGGFAHWAAAMRELYPAWLVFFLIFSIGIGSGLYLGMNRAHRMKELETKTASTRIIVSELETKTASTRIIVSAQPHGPNQDPPAPQQAQSGNR
jgi:hypothetical protein